MKGVAHFASAIAIASFLPQVVERSAQGGFVLLLAGLGGLMPDTLDFRLARFLSRPDVEIDDRSAGAAPGGLDAQRVAECLAAAVERARRTSSPVYVRLGTIRLGADLWQRYSIRFDRGQVEVHSGPLVDGAQTPVDGQESGRFKSIGCSAVTVPIWRSMSRRNNADKLSADNFTAAVVVDVFSGTVLEFRPREEGVEVVFLPWHRRWSHSLILAACLGGVAALLFDPLSGLVYALGSLVHILEDQLGYMGSSMLYPFRRRIGGLELFHSGDALPNLLTVWLSAVLLLLNVDRFSAAPQFGPWRLLAAGVVVPWAVIGVLWWLVRRKWHDRRKAGDALERQASLRQLMLADVSQDGERAPVQSEQVDG